MLELVSPVQLAEPPEPTPAAELERVYAEHGSSLLRQCLAITNDLALAEAALHAAFSKLTRHHAGIQGAPAELSWLKHVAARCCLNLLELRTREGADARRTGATSRSPGELEAPSTLTALVAFLRENGRAVALLLLQQGLTQEEIARRLRCCRPTTSIKLRAITEPTLKG